MPKSSIFVPQSGGKAPTHRQAPAPDRQAAVDARAALLAKFNARPAVDHEGLASLAAGRAEREATRRAVKAAVAAQLAAERAAGIAASAAEVARVEAERVAVEIEAQRRLDEAAADLVTKAADAKSARDARYAARQSRQRKRR